MTCRLRAALLLLAGCLLASPALAQSTAMAEYAVKSALLFKLPLFVYQPEARRRGGDLDMCLLGSNPFGNALEKLAKTSIDGRNVRLHKLASAAEAGDCDFLFIARSEADALDGTLRQLQGLPVVTVSDIEGFARASGMVEFALGGDGAPISILINRKAAQKHGIEFNAQLLRLAKVVEP
ncbi:MAG: YfiR family protein [Rhodocyclaceae bacterium]|nr:YfiR family protein [Rhodocyclaceae bacterium]